MTEFLNETIAAEVNSAAPLEVEVMKEALLEVDVPLFYIHSGKKEIQDYVENVSKPEINNYIKDYAEPIVSKVVSEISEPQINGFVENTIKPEISEFAKTEMKQYADRAESAAKNSEEKAQEAAGSAESAKKTSDDFDIHVLEVVKGFNQNAEDKTEAFNTNAAQKQQAVDNAADDAETSAYNAAQSAQSAAASKTAAAQSATEASTSAAAAEESMRKVNAGWNLFDFKWSDHLQEDIRWLRGDTFSWNSGAVYTAAYNELLSEYNAAQEQGLGESEKINGITIAFWRSPKGYKIANYTAARETDIALLYNTVGVAWYYIIDVTNQRFKLPRTKFGFTGIRSGAGNFVPESLPNVTGVWEGIQLNNDAVSGAFYAGSTLKYKATGTALSTGKGLGFDASRVSTSYQDGAPVQERATEGYLYFWVGEFEQTAVENTAGLNAELFNAKADISYVNGLMSSNGLYVKRAAYTDDTTYLTVVTEWFKDAAMTQRVWVYQRGYITSGYASSVNPAVITYPKPFQKVYYANRTQKHNYTGIISSAHYWSGFSDVSVSSLTFYRDVTYQSVSYWEAEGK